MSFFDKLVGLKDQIKKFFQHRKKVSALENFSTGINFPHKRYLHLIKGCLDDGFLGEKEADFLDHMLTRYEVNYLDWAHKTKWLKGIIASRQPLQVPNAPQFFFEFDKKQNVPINIPVEILNPARSGQMGKRL